MKRLAIILASVCSSCAIGRADSHGVSGIAIGRAKIEHCRPCDNSCDKPKPACDRIQGGSLSTGIAELLESAAAAVGAWFGVVP